MKQKKGHLQIKMLRNCDFLHNNYAAIIHVYLHITKNT